MGDSSLDPEGPGLSAREKAGDDISLFSGLLVSRGGPGMVSPALTDANSTE